MKVRFGMLMTDAVGKAGGQCIQRFRGTNVLRNITQPVQSAKAKKNKQRHNVALMAQFWKSISSAHRAEWVAIGQKLERVNTWGDVVRLSGRQAFFSLNNLFIPINGYPVNPFTVSEIRPTLTVSSVIIMTNTTSIVYTGGGTGDITHYEWKFERLRNLTSYVDVRKQKRFGLLLEVASGNSIYNALRLANGPLTPGQVLGISIRAISPFGVASPWQTVISVVQ